MASAIERTASGEPTAQIDHLPNASGYAGDVGPSTGPSNQHDQGHTGGHHIVPVSTYLKVISALAILLVVTILASMVDFAAMPIFGPRGHAINIVIAVAIAVVKAVLIILYFMHVKYSSKMTAVFAVAAFVFVAIMFALTFSDYQTRGWLPQPGK